MAALAIVGQRVSDAEAYLALFENVQKQCPVLTFAYGGHVELVAKALDVVDGCQTANLVVALHHAQCKVFRRDIDSGDGVVFVANQIGRAAQGTVFARHVGYLLLEFLGHPAVVAVAEGNIASLGALYGAVAGNARSVVLLQEFNFYSLVLFCKLFQNVACVVRRAVIGDEELEVSIGLVEHALNAVSKVFAGIESGHND